MRQAGFLAAAGLYALDHNVSRLRDDHARAKRLGEAAAKLPFVDKVRSQHVPWQSLLLCAVSYFGQLTES